jgi:DNA helicase HerA-like ATPase
VLLDIAERRSLGIILIGAQQTASEVERRIVANSSIKVVGRLDPAEAGRPEYGFLPASLRAGTTRLGFVIIAILARWLPVSGRPRRRYAPSRHLVGE